jgi:hypothetical protein
MKKNLEIVIKLNEKELKNKEKIILAYKPLYEEVRKVVSDLYVLGSICEKLESLGLIVIDKKEKAYFNNFKEYQDKNEIEYTKDQFVSSSYYFEELYEQIIDNNHVIKIIFNNENKVNNQYIKNSIEKWKIN